MSEKRTLTDALHIVSCLVSEHRQAHKRIAADIMACVPVKKRCPPDATNWEIAMASGANQFRAEVLANIKRYTEGK